MKLYFAKKAHRVLGPVDYSLLICGSAYFWISYKDYFRAALHVAGERRAAPHVARGDRRAALDAVHTGRCRSRW